MSIRFLQPGQPGIQRIGRVAGFAFLLTCMLEPSSAWGQGQPAEGPRAELLGDLLLSSDRVLSDVVTGPVWDMSPGPGRRFIQLPLRLIPGRATGVLEAPRLDVAGGRFMIWQLPDPASDPSGVGGVDSNARPTDQQLLTQLTGLLTGSVVPGQGADAEPAAAAPAIPEVVAEAPRLARALTIIPADVEGNPTGSPRVAWELNRGIPGGIARAGDVNSPYPYGLLMDRDQLVAQEPPRPERLVRQDGEGSREFSFRRRESDAAYREASIAYRDLVDRVRSLSERFEQELPGMVWAVFEVSSFSDGWELRGHEAGPWAMRFDDWQLLSTLSRGSGGQGVGDGAYSSEELQDIARLAAIARNPHPWTQQALATAVAYSAYPAKAAPDDAASKLIQVILAGNDPLARNQMVYALAAVQPATPAVAALLNDAARRTGEAAIQLAALRAELGVQLASDPGVSGVAGAIDVTNRLLADEAGPDAGLVIRQFLVSVPENPDSAAAIIGGLRFDDLTPGRFDAAVAAALRSAGDRPEIVGGWLNRQWLGSSNPQVVRRTLDLLIRADAPAPVVAPLARDLLNLVFGPPAGGEPSDGRVEPVDLTITAGLPLDSANHALFRLLQAGDPALRKQGWLVLRHFELTDRAAGAPAPAEGAVDPLASIVDAGLGRPDTPESLVPFLARQPDTARANGPLVRVLIWGDPAASRRAARVFYGSERQFGVDLATRDANDREKFAQRVYNDLGDGVEPVSGLMRSDGSVPGWFAEQLAAGNLPEPAAWAEAAGGEAALLSLAVGSDDALASGAFAALAAAAGGDRDLQLKMIDRFKDQRKTLSAEAMETAWAEARKDIYTQRLAAAAGKYRLVITVTGMAPADGGLGLASDPALGTDPAVIEAQQQAGAADRTERIVLGFYQLQANGREVKFSGGVPALDVPTDVLAIRLTNPSQLKSLKADELKALPLERSTEPLDLLPDEGGSWRGSLVLSDGRGLELVMEPIAANSGEQPSATPADPAVKPRPGGALNRRPFQ